MGKIQELFDATQSGDFMFTPGEYEGPLTITRPCVVDGAKSTLWANRGPVLIIQSPNVTVKNLRVEVAGNPAEVNTQEAVRTSDPGTVLENIEVCGKVVGLGGESENWDLPAMVTLGEFASGQENVFDVTINAADHAELVTQMRDIRLEPAKLYPGENHIRLTTEELRNNTILFGEIMVKSKVSRRIYVTGKSMKDAPVHTQSVPIREASRSVTVVSAPPTSFIPPEVDTSSSEKLKRGQRVTLKDLNGSSLTFMLETGAGQSVDLDCYCFQLGSSGKVMNDENLIFFGNMESTDHAIKVSAADEKPVATVDLDKVDGWVQKIPVCFSIYGDDPRENFSRVNSPAVRVLNGGREIYRCEMTDLSEEKTVVALEVYRYKSEWKLNFVGAGYRNGLAKLCESFGVNVE